MKQLKTWYNKQKYAKPIVFIVGFAVLGSLVLLLSRAAGPFASVETENASLSGATKVSDANASGGSYLQFGSDSTTPPPATGEFPDENSTGLKGAGVSLAELKPYTGSYYVKTDGAVVDKMDISGTIHIQANNVTIKRSRVRVNNWYVIRVYSGYTGTVIEDNDIIGVGTDKQIKGVAFSNFTLKRNNISGVTHGVDLSDNVLVEGNYIHNLQKADAGQHTDGLITARGKNSTVRGNTVIHRPEQTSAYIIRATTGTVDNFLIENNLFGGGNYTLYCRINTGTSYGHPTNIKYINNTFIRNSYNVGLRSFDYATTANTSAQSSDPKLILWQNNVWQDDGSLIP